MKRINEILAVVIISLMGVLVAAVGLRVYDTYMTNREIRTQIKKQEQVLARNRENHDRVQEMRQEIQELSADREKLQQFLDEIRLENQETVPAASMTEPFEPGDSGMSGHESMSENTPDIPADMVQSSMSGNDTMSGNELSMSGNELSMSGNSTMSGNGLSMSGNSTMSGNGLSMSGNSTMSGNGLSMSDNSTMSGNGLSMSGNSTMSGNMLDVLTGLVRPKISLEERRRNRTSLEETFVANMEDQMCLENSRIDFSDKKIACLGDSGC